MHTDREIAKQYLLEKWDGDESERSIASKLGVSRKTVNNAKSDLKESGKLGNLAQFSKFDKRAQVREYIDENPDASNREVAESVEADVSHATVGNWRNEWEEDDVAESGERQMLEENKISSCLAKRSLS